MNGGHSLTFRDYFNHDDIFGQNPSLFISNPWQTNITTLTIEGYGNYGDIVCTKYATYICALAGTEGYGGIFNSLNEACSAQEENISTGAGLTWIFSSNSKQYAHINSYSIEAVSGDGKISPNNSGMKIEKSNDEYRVVNADVDRSHVVFSIFAYA